VKREGRIFVSKQVRLSSGWEAWPFPTGRLNLFRFH